MIPCDCFLSTHRILQYPDPNGLFEGDLFGDVSAGPGASSAPGGGGLRRDLEEAAAAVTPRAAGGHHVGDARHDSDDDEEDGMDHYDGGMSPSHRYVLYR